MSMLNVSLPFVNQSIYNNELYNPFFKLIRQKNIPIIDFLTKIRENSAKAPESFRSF